MKSMKHHLIGLFLLKLAWEWERWKVLKQGRKKINSLFFKAYYRAFLHQTIAFM